MACNIQTCVYKLDELADMHENLSHDLQWLAGVGELLFLPHLIGGSCATTSAQAPFKTSLLLHPMSPTSVALL